MVHSLCSCLFPSFRSLGCAWLRLFCCYFFVYPTTTIRVILRLMIACTLAAAAAAAELVCTTLKGFSSSSGAIYDRCDGEDELPSQCSAVQTKPWANQASPPVRKMSMQLTALKWSIAAIAYYFVCHNWLHMHLCIHAQTLTRCATDGTDNFNNAQIFVWEPPHLCAATYLWSDSLPICYPAIIRDESYLFSTIWRKT